ncbi:MAG: Carnitine monooxygenase, oxygenase component CntA [uncultured Thermomicrobiales bacterium]|uniref:Carnitine monooxygenase, oxygenase component CntA n=1 Tax=uncultured Thermomicrobiales bacterium TaxID=1645740 RepID=A0A6J4UZU6_9BACT|nr:MAG: Carnitine monooxygenase, oxygenase component CntA [uncultured Thermomicrobiales bacterium]
MLGEARHGGVDPRLGAALAEGYTLPAAWYTEPAWFAREQEQIFRRTWQYVGLAEQVAKPGDFFTAQVGTVPIIVTRDETGTVRAFVNVCRHRGSILVAEECGHGKIFQCPYHAWTYGLDGALRAAPGMREEASFDRGQFSLFGLRAELWGPFIFVNLDAAAAPLAAALGELPALVAATGAPLDRIRRRVRTVYDIAANWKVVVDNYLECYHCPVAHPGFTQLIDTNNYTITEYDLFSTQGGALREEKQGAESLYDTSGAVRDGFYAYLWPNFTLNIYPGQGNTSINLFLPLGPDRTRAIFEYCFVETVGEEEERDFVRFIEQVQVEDIVLCETVQRGLGTGFFDQGKLMLWQEGALRHFQRLVHRFVTA